MGVYHKNLARLRDNLLDWEKLMNVKYEYEDGEGEEDSQEKAEDSFE